MKNEISFNHSKIIFAEERKQKLDYCWKKISCVIKNKDGWKWFKLKN